MGRSIVAVVAGFLLTVVLAFGAQFVLMTLFHREPVNDSDREPTMLFMLLLTTNAAAAVGGYLADWVAIRRPLAHALVLGVLGLLGSVLLTITYWSNEPAWYHVSALALVLPATGLGGWMYARQRGLRGEG